MPQLLAAASVELGLLGRIAVAFALAVLLLIIPEPAKDYSVPDGVARVIRGLAQATANRQYQKL